MRLDGRFSASELEEWADAVEARDDIDFETREVIDLIAEISTPELDGSLTAQRCQELLDHIDSLDGVVTD